MIEFVLLRSKAGLYVPRALPIRELCENQDTELFLVGKMLRAEVAAESFRLALKGFQRHEVNDLVHIRGPEYMSFPPRRKSSGRFAESAMCFQVEGRHEWHLS
jgi:hypothetical protein